MNELIYLEPDEEITSVIDRLRKSEGDALALVIPRGSTLAQSIVNLKLLKRSAEELDKEISLVSNDRIGRNLASQIGITVYSKPSEAERARPIEPVKKEVSEVMPSGFRVNSYYANKSSEEAEDEPVDEADLEDDETEGEEEADDGEIEASELEEIRSHEAGDYGVKEKRQIKVHIEDEYEDENEDGDEGLVESDDDAVQQDVAVEPRKREAVTKGDNQNGRVTPPKVKNISGSRRIILAVIAATVVILLGMTYVFIPNATVAIKLKTTTNPISKEVFADQSIKVVDTEKLNIPGQFVSLDKEVSKTFNSTGAKKEPVEKATGKITVSNAWNEDPVTLEKGSRFVSSGKGFLSTAAVTVPGADSTLVNGQSKIIPGTAEVSVVAEVAGEDYNLAPASFVISSIALNKQGSITGKSTVAMAGGTSRDIKFVSSDDIKNAEADVMKDVVDSSKKELLTKAESEQVVLFESKITSEIVSKESSKAVGAEATTFDYKVNVSLSVFGFKEADARELMKQIASATLGGEEMLLEPDKAELKYEVEDDSKAADGIVKLELSYQAKIGQKMSEAEVKDQIKGKKSLQAKSLLEGDTRISSVDMRVWPSNLFRIPLIKNRIDVSFGYAD